MSEPHHPCILVVINDLIFQTKIQSTAHSLGFFTHQLSSADTIGAVLGEFFPGLVIFDLNSARGEIFGAIEALRTAADRPHVVAFCSHVDVALMDRARLAGADEVLARSQFTRDLPQIIVRGRSSTPTG